MQLKHPDGMNQHPISAPPEIASALIRQVPKRFTCFFANLEFHETPGGMTVSEDFFALTRNLFGKYSRRPIALDAVSLGHLVAFARNLMSTHDTKYVVVDVVGMSKGETHAFLDLESFPRLKGGDDFYKRKHEQYTSTYAVLRNVPVAERRDA